jgi:predicted GNAT family acetyltransferase
MFPDRSLAQRLEFRLMQDHHAYVQAYPYDTGVQTCSILKAGGGIAIATPLPYINSAYGVGIETDVSLESLRQIEAFFKTHHLSSKIEVCPFTNPDFLALLGQAQYYPSKFKTAYYRVLGDVELSTEDFRVVPIVDSQRELWVKTSLDVDVFDEADPMTQLAYVNTLRKHSICFLAMMDGEAVGASALSIQDGSAILYFTSTREMHRKRGVQQAMIQARLAYAQAQGCDVAFTTTIPGNNSMRNVMRAGFQIAYTKMSMTKQTESNGDYAKTS